MRIVKIPKRTKGKFRTIYVPNEVEMAQLRSVVGRIAQKAERLCPEGVAHGFTRFRNPVTNAQAHVGHAFTTCFDLQDFFDTVTEDRLKGKLKDEEMKMVLVDGAARQGLPTSPAVANLAASDLDKAILRWRDKTKHQFVYTRYADDLSFSYDDPALRAELEKHIPQIIKRCGFAVNPSKTRTMAAKAGRRIITGVAVGDHEVYAPRSVRRRLRAATHQKNRSQARGLAEWCKMKVPAQREEIAQHECSAAEIAKLQKVWKLPHVRPDMLPDKSPEENLGDDCLVTPDPVYMLGMSTWTTGWTSCMGQPSGQYRKGVVFWTFLRGTRIACFLSAKTKIVAGVERRVMRARTLVHELRNGVKVFDRFYGNPQDIPVLRTKLEEAGYISIADAKSKYGSVSVVGHAPAQWKAYFDNLKSKTSKASAGKWKGRLVRVVHI